MKKKYSKQKCKRATKISSKKIGRKKLLLWQYFFGAFLILSCSLFVSGYGRQFLVSFHRPAINSEQVVVTILCYHHVDLPFRTQYNVSHEKLLQQIVALQKAGFTFIKLSQLEAYYYSGETIPSRSALLTFDDGYSGTYTAVYPLLKKINIPWSTFIYPEVINQAKPYTVTWSQMKELADNGVEIGCHTMTHPFLTSAPAAIVSPDAYQKWLHHEIFDSKQEIEQRLGIQVRYFAEPYGALDTTVYSVIKNAGYSLALNVSDMNNDAQTNPLNLNRIVVDRSDSVPSIVSRACMPPIHFMETTPADLSRSNNAHPQVSFTLSNPDQYVTGSVRFRLTGFKGVHLTNKQKISFSEWLILRQPSFYLGMVMAEDKTGATCRGTWLFLYNRKWPAYIAEGVQ